MARPGYSTAVKGGATVKSITYTVAQLGALVAYAAGSLKFRMPEKGQIIGVTANVAAGGGTHSTSTLDVSNAGTSLLVAPFDVAAMVAAAGTVVDKEGSALAAGAASVAKDAEIRLTAAESGGTSPTVRGLTVQIDYVPLGD